MNKSLLIPATLLITGLVGCAPSKPKPAAAPHYAATKATVLLSAKVDRLTETQTKQFWTLARKAARRATKGDGGDWSLFKDDTLYVAKTAVKHQYELVYQVKATKPMPVTMAYDMLVRLNANRLSRPDFTVQQFTPQLGQ